MSISLFWIICVIENFIIPMYVLYVSGKQSGQKKKHHKEKGFWILFYIWPWDNLRVTLRNTDSIPWSFTSWTQDLGQQLQGFHPAQAQAQVQHIHSTRVSPRSSAESRATHHYFLTNLISACFPTVSPFLIMRQDSTVFSFCVFWIRNTILAEKCKLYHFAQSSVDYSLITLEKSIVSYF